MSRHTVLEILFRRPTAFSLANVASAVTSIKSKASTTGKPHVQHDSWIASAIRNLEQALRAQFHSRIQINEFDNSSLKYHEHIRNAYIEPVLRAANQNRLECLPPLVVKEEVTNIADSIRFDIVAGDLPFPEHVPSNQIRHPLPVLIFLPNSTIDSRVWDSTSGVQSCAESDIILTEANAIIKQQPQRDICITDTNSTLLFRAAYAGTKHAVDEILYEQITDLLKFPLRAIIASLIWSAVEKTSLVPAFQPEYFRRAYIQDSSLPAGALNDPPGTGATFEDVLKLPSRSDFDYFAVVNDPPTGRLLSQWMTQVPEHYTQNPLLQTSDWLEATANSFADFFPPLKPLFDIQPLPMETQNYLHCNKRSLAIDLYDELQTCKHFRVNITEALPVYDRHDGRSFSCRVTSANGLHPQELHLKLFDDRQMKFQPMNQYETSLEAWFTMEVLPTTATQLVRNADAAFRRLSHAQGSLLPYFYGAHQFSLPDGSRCWGILTELIRGVPLRELSKKLPEAAKIEVIHAMRHFVRVLQFAEVKRSWWLYSDILVSINQESGSVSWSCAVMNMSHARFSTLEGQIMPADDYREVQQLLYYTLGYDLVDEHFEPMEEWDYYMDDREAYVGEGWIPGDSDEYDTNSNSV